MEKTPPSGCRVVAEVISGIQSRQSWHYDSLTALSLCAVHSQCPLQPSHRPGSLRETERGVIQTCSMQVTLAFHMTFLSSSGLTFSSIP